MTQKTMARIVSVLFEREGLTLRVLTLRVSSLRVVGRSGGSREEDQGKLYTRRGEGETLNATAPWAPRAQTRRPWRTTMPNRWPTCTRGTRRPRCIRGCVHVALKDREVTRDRDVDTYISPTFVRLDGFQHQTALSRKGLEENSLNIPSH